MKNLFFRSSFPVSPDLASTVMIVIFLPFDASSSLTFTSHPLAAAVRNSPISSRVLARASSQ